MTIGISTRPGQPGRLPVVGELPDRHRPPSISRIAHVKVSFIEKIGLDMRSIHGIEIATSGTFLASTHGTGKKYPKFLGDRLDRTRCQPNITITKGLELIPLGEFRRWIGDPTRPSRDTHPRPREDRVPLQD
jgi:hypothetical protein